jgi:pyruvate dehydrogenase E1 component beta subunit
MRKITYCQAINEALGQVMSRYDEVIVIGQGVTSPWYVGGTCAGLLDEFGPKRVIDTPVSESAIAGAAIGAAIAGLRPVVVFPRMDFMMYAMDAIINHAAKWRYMFGGKAHVPIVFWSIINRGGSQGAQHSQDFTWLFANIPGLKVVSPENAYDAKGCMVGAILDDDPVVFVDNRERYNVEGDVPDWLYASQLPFEPVLDEDYLIRGLLNVPYPAPCSEVLEKEYYLKIVR